MELSDKFILGTNPLTGVNHFLGRRARERRRQIDVKEIASIMTAAFSAGATGFNFSPDPLLYTVFKNLRHEGVSFDFNVYLMLPDMYRFRNALLTNGVMGVANSLLEGLAPSVKVRIAMKGARSLIMRDPAKALEAYIDVELERVKRILPKEGKVVSVLANEFVVDLALALGVTKLPEIFIRHLRNHEIVPGFVTRNLLLFSRFWRETMTETEQVAVMTPFNPLGFQMIPSREACERTLAELDNRFYVIAMSPFAAGQVSPEESLRYLDSHKRINSFAVGVSNSEQAQQTFHMAKSLFRRG